MATLARNFELCNKSNITGVHQTLLLSVFTTEKEQYSD